MPRWLRWWPASSSARSSRSPSTGSPGRHAPTCEPARWRIADGSAARSCLRHLRCLSPGASARWPFTPPARTRVACARRFSARRSSARSTRRCPRRGHSFTFCVASIRHPPSAGPDPERGRARQRQRSRSRGAEGGAIERARARDRLRARRRGLWLGARPQLVVTNAHVVAGEDDTSVTLDSGGQLEATVVHYDPHNDLALLAVPGSICRRLSTSSNARAVGPTAR